jgi:hypothetical protein
VALASDPDFVVAPAPLDAPVVVRSVGGPVPAAAAALPALVDVSVAAGDVVGVSPVITIAGSAALPAGATVVVVVVVVLAGLVGAAIAGSALTAAAIIGPASAAVTVGPAPLAVADDAFEEACPEPVGALADELTAGSATGPPSTFVVVTSAGASELVGDALVPGVVAGPPDGEFGAASTG